MLVVITNSLTNITRHLCVTNSTALFKIYIHLLKTACHISFKSYLLCCPGRGAAVQVKAFDGWGCVLFENVETELLLRHHPLNFTPGVYVMGDNLLDLARTYSAHTPDQFPGKIVTQGWPKQKKKPANHESFQCKSETFPKGLCNTKCVISGLVNLGCYFPEACLQFAPTDAISPSCVTMLARSRSRIFFSSWNLNLNACN